MDNLYWSNQALNNTTQLMTLMLWLLGSFIVLCVPGLISLIISSYTHSKQEDLRIYIARFVSYHTYARLVDLLHACGIATLVLIGLYRGGYLIEDSSWLELGRSAGLLVVSGLGLRLLRALSFALWKYVFMTREEQEALAQDYFVLDWFRALLYPILSLLMLSPISLEVAVGCSVGIISITFLLSIVQVCRRLMYSPGSYVYLFLYLCAHELAPIAYLVALGVYIVRNKVLLNIFI